MQGRGSKLSITHQSHQRTLRLLKDSTVTIYLQCLRQCMFTEGYILIGLLKKKFVSLSQEQMLTEIIFTSRNQNIFAQFRFPSFDYNVLQIKKKTLKSNFCRRTSRAFSTNLFLFRTLFQHSLLQHYTENILNMRLFLHKFTECFMCIYKT